MVWCWCEKNSSVETFCLLQVSGSSVRRYSGLFAANEMQSCKTCHTLAPTFLARTAALQEGAPFRVSLDGEWALLDWFLRRSWHEKEEFGQAQCVGGYLKPIPTVSWAEDKDKTSAEQRGAVIPAHEWRRLWGLAEDTDFYFRSKLSQEFVSWWEVLLPLGSRVGMDRMVKEFMEKNDLKEITGVDAEKRFYGCTVRTPNCPLDWLYKGWAIPPCCRRTLWDVLNFADELFHENKIKYAITDGALLGGLKIGRLLDWDADVDLHIEDESFSRLESLRGQIEKAGYWLRLHELGESYLLTANKFNYLYIELNRRSEPFPEEPWLMQLDGKWFPTLDHPGRNVSAWYGEGIYTHRARYIPPWEEDAGNHMFCANPGHHNCVDDLPHGRDCHRDGPCKRRGTMDRN